MFAKPSREVQTTRLLFFFLSTVSRILAQECSGSANFDVVFDDTEIKRVAVNEVNQVSSFTVGKPFTLSTTLPLLPRGKSSYAGENGVAYYWIGKMLFPAGRRGLYSLFIFDMDTGRWSDTDVYCKPVGAAFWYSSELEIVGFCEVNNSSPTPCIPYFKLKLINGQWTDVSGHGLCSYDLSTTNLTNPIILSFFSQYGYSVKLYIAERETGVLHEIDLGQQLTEHYNIPDQGENDLKINHIVPVATNDGSFTGVRIEAWSPNSIKHVLFSSLTQQFLQTDVQTETIAFDSYNLNYFVSFTESLRTLIVSFRNGTTRQYPLAVTVDDPGECENVARPYSHHLICLTENGRIPVMINTVDGTNQTIPVGDSSVANLGMLNENSFYVLNSHQELSLFMIANSGVVHIGTYTVRSGNNFRLMGFSSNITCNISLIIANESNSMNTANEDGNSTNETGSTNTTTNVPTNTPTISTGTTEVTDSTHVSTEKAEETTATSYPNNTSGTEESDNNIRTGSPVGKPNEGSNNQTANLSTGAWIVICVLIAVIAGLVVFIIVVIIVIRQQHCCNSKRQLALSHSTSILSEDGNSLQQGDSKDAISQTVGKEKLQLTPDSKPNSVHRTLSSGGIYYDKSEQFVIYVDTDRVSIISAQPCSDENTSMPQTPEFPQMVQI